MPVRNALGRGAELVGRRCLLLFLGSPWSVLRAAEGPAGWLAPSAFGEGLTGLAVKLASVGAAAAAQREPRTSALRIALRRINDASFMVSLVPLGVMLGRGGSRSGQRAAAVTLAPAGARQEPSRPPSQRPPEDRDRHPLVWNPDARLSNPREKRQQSPLMPRFRLCLQGAARRSNWIRRAAPVRPQR